MWSKDSSKYQKQKSVMQTMAKYTIQIRKPITSTARLECKTGRQMTCKNLGDQLGALLNSSPSRGRRQWKAKLCWPRKVRSSTDRTNEVSVSFRHLPWNRWSSATLLGQCLLTVIASSPCTSCQPLLQQGVKPFSTSSQRKATLWFFLNYLFALTPSELSKDFVWHSSWLVFPFLVRYRMNSSSWKLLAINY